MRKITKLKKSIGLTLLLGFSMGILGLSLPSFAQAPDLNELKGPLFQESLEPRPVDPDSFQGKIISAIKKVSPAVVSISTEKTIGVPGLGEDRFFTPPFQDFEEFFRRFFEQFPQKEFKQRGLGSGIIINEDGYILTNEHVIHGVDEIVVTLSTNKSYKAQVVETDVESDIAVLKIDADEELPVVTLGDSDNVQIGQWVIAVGNPFGFALSQLNKKYEPTVTVGVISATGRAIEAGGRGRGGNRVYTDLLQTDASINPGNSGGPLVNIHGEVIGINSAILSPTGGSVGIGFAIPVNKAKRLLQSLAKYGEIKWPWIGIYMQELTPELAERFDVKKGVLVADVIPDSPADKAGIKPGDVIQKINGAVVETPFDLKEAVLKAKIGEKITLTLIRAGEEVKVELVTAPKPEEITETKARVEEKLMGIKVAEITPELRQRYDISPGEEGVVVVDVESGGPAARVGISVGDVIKGVNRKEITSLSDFEEVMSEVQPGATVLVRLRHGRWTMFVTVKTRS